jgi:hypothetical protein
MRKFLLLAAGLVVLFLGAYSLPQEGIPYSKVRTVKLGPFEASARTRERIDIPAPIGWILVAAGAGLLLTGAYVKSK